MHINSGIYLIENNINHKKYVGQSVNVKRRFSEHKEKAFNQRSKEYNYPLYRAIRKYGLTNFSFKIIEKCEQEKLNEKEIKWIKYYESYKNGYNQTIGGDSSLINRKEEMHPNHKLSKTEIIDIRTRYNNRERKEEVYSTYKNKINKSGFHKIWNGITWKNIMPEVYTKENIDFHKHNTGNAGSKNGKTKIVEEDVKYIRECRKNGLNKKEVYLNFREQLTYKSFENIWYYMNWKEVKVE